MKNNWNKDMSLAPRDREIILRLNNTFNNRVCQGIWDKNDKCWKFADMEMYEDKYIDFYGYATGCVLDKDILAWMPLPPIEQEEPDPNVAIIPTITCERVYPEVEK